MFVKFAAVILSVAVLPILAQYVHDGECPSDVQVVQNFDLDKYMGKWFEIKRYEVYFQRDAECSQALYTKSEDGQSVIVENSAIKPNQPRSTTVGTATQPDSQVAKLSVSFSKHMPVTAPNYWILDTDYENYSIVWNCQSLKNGKSAEVAWVLSRTPTLNADVEEKVNEIVTKYLKEDKFRITAQDAETCGY